MWLAFLYRNQPFQWIHNKHYSSGSSKLKCKVAFNTCSFLGEANHIHCVRQDCNFVLESSGQLYAHKRKHDRKDRELESRTSKFGGIFNGNSHDRPPSSGSETSNGPTPPLNFPQPQKTFSPFASPAIPSAAATAAALANASGMLSSHHFMLNDMVRGAVLQKVIMT